MNKIASVLFFSLSIFHFLLKAQDDGNNKEEKHTKDSLSEIKTSLQRDFVDIWKLARHKKIEEEIPFDTVKAGKTHTSIVPVLGYTLQTGFAAVLSGSVAFYTGNSQSQKLSSIFGSLNYTQYKQFIVPLQANIWSKGNKYNVVTDWRYMKYPSTTYGLGTKTTRNDAFTLDFSYLKIHQTVFKSVGTNFYAGLGYYLDYLWNIKQVNLSPVSLINYKINSEDLASGIALRLLYDSRLNQINPDNGSYGNIVYRPNFTFMGSRSNWQSMLLEFRKYLKLSSRRKHVLALWSYNWLTTSGNPPYLLLPSIGWDDPFNTGRGYIQGRFRGKNMLYLETEYRFNILRNGFLGGVVFMNAQSFSKDTYKELINFVPGWGGGLRIKLNKFSGSNLCIDYGFGLNGSRGFFINLNEVF